MVLAVKLVRHHLKDSKQKVDIEGNLSSTTAFNISVIQGSILGPILFLIFISDIRYNSSELIFADDTAGLASGKTSLNYLTISTPKLKRLLADFAPIRWLQRTTPNEDNPDLMYEFERIHNGQEQSETDHTNY
jgi:hypothetical protein